MIRPARFESNPHTAESNKFQGKNPSPPAQQQADAEIEFDGLRVALEAGGNTVPVAEVGDAVAEAGGDGEAVAASVPEGPPVTSVGVATLSSVALAVAAIGGAAVPAGVSDVDPGCPLGPFGLSLLVANRRRASSRAFLASTRR